jgi:hypothetical protein
VVNMRCVLKNVAEKHMLFIFCGEASDYSWAYQYVCWDISLNEQECPCLDYYSDTKFISKIV